MPSTRRSVHRKGVLVRVIVVPVAQVKKRVKSINVAFDVTINDYQVCFFSQDTVSSRGGVVAVLPVTHLPVLPEHPLGRSLFKWSQRKGELPDVTGYSVEDVGSYR